MRERTAVVVLERPGVRVVRDDPESIAKRIRRNREFTDVEPLAAPRVTGQPERCRRERVVRIEARRNE
ncbi:hypothetical protein AB5985_25140 [Burkholderia cepacia]